MNTPTASSSCGFVVPPTMTVVTAGDLGERFGDQVVQMLGAAEHRSARIRGCASEERRLQRRRWAAWAPKIRRRLPAVTTASFSLGCFWRLRGGLAAFEHLQHPVGDDEAADDVRRREDYGQESEDDGDRRVGGRRNEQRAHEDDAVDRVGARHQGRVEHRRHLGDDLDADKDRQHEERELVEQLAGHLAAAETICFARSLTISPPWVTQLPLVISSSKSSTIDPSLTRCSSRLATLRAYSWLACRGIVDGTLRVPMMVTPPTSTSSPAFVSSTLPPVSAARSMMTDPGRMPLTMSPVTRRGARRPGTAAVVMTTSDFATCSPMSSRCLRRNSSDCSRAYPPSPSCVSRASSMNVAPRDCTSSFTAGRTSYAETTAPSRRAVAIACRPATPAPMTRTRAGGIVPAAVIIIGKNLPRRPAAMRTAL